VESPENQLQVFAVPTWKSLRDSHISTAPTTTTYISAAKTTSPKEINDFGWLNQTAERSAS
jgi:hypothetical protein